MSWLVLAIIVLLVWAVVVIKRIRAIKKREKSRLLNSQMTNELRQLDSSIETLPPQPFSPYGFVPFPEIIGQPFSTLNDNEVEYTHLKNLLEAKCWREADVLTRAIILKLTGCENQGYIDYHSMQKFPCSDLKKIDRLWIKYSNDQFGFTVQSRLWDESGQDCVQFCNRVGWSKNGVFIQESDLIYNLDALRGHLPVAYLPIVGGCLWIVLDSTFWLSQRLKDCCEEITR